jgi:nucleotide-binding universal stress UspA family protein
MGRIVVGVDGSKHALVALRWALQEAQVRGAPLDVVAAWQYPVAVDDAIPFAVGVDPGLLEKGAVATIDDALARAGVTGDAPGITRIAAPGPAAEVLIQAAEGADLLVVGTRGRGGFKGLLLGSVSSQCAQHASCPVVVVPDDDRAHRGRS